MTDKINVALVYGGRSVEHDVSIISARNIQDNIDQKKYSVYRFGIDKSGKWFLMTEVGKNFSKGHGISLSLDASDPYFLDLDDNQKNICNTILSESNNLLSIINDILDFSKIEAGKIELEEIPFNLGRLIDDVAHKFALMAEQKGLEFNSFLSFKKLLY